MRFRNDIHKRRFEKEIKKMDKKDNTQILIEKVEDEDDFDNDDFDDEFPICPCCANKKK